MELSDLITADAVLPSLRSHSKKQILQELSGHAVRHLPALDEREVFETLLQRERLGSTGIGDGVAIPHGKLPGLDRLFGLVARLLREPGILDRIRAARDASALYALLTHTSASQAA